MRERHCSDRRIPTYFVRDIALLLAFFCSKICHATEPASQQTVHIFLSSSKCNPQHFTKKANPESDTSYFHCNADGTLAKRDCPQGKLFNKTSLECGFPKEFDSPLSLPQFQAPDDICSGGIPLTRLSAPVVCNPSISTCPDGYFCTLHSRTGTSYCCQSVIEPFQESTLCTGNQVTYFEPMTGLPKSCVLSSSSSCPTGFGCNLIGGSFTRCCGRDFGCPINSAGYVNPSTGAYVQCNRADPASCPSGFICTQSSMFNTGICCSDTSSSPTDVCGGDSPLSRPNPCAASTPCPAGFSCRNGRCCPSRGLCPAGIPLGGVTACSTSNPCPNNYQCVTSNAQQYCCPAPEHVCGQPRDAGVPCETRVAAVSRYYFDAATGSCRAFQFSQCAGNGNNFDTLEQCEGFCLESQCPQGMGLRAGPSIATCSAAQAMGDLTAIATPDTTCPSHYSCVQPLFGSNFVCCTSSEHVCRDSVTAGTACFGAFLTIQRFHYNADRGQCEPFQYYGCNGSGNNFVTKRQCEAACQPQVKNACNGVAPLNDEGDYVQRCSENVPCPRGSWCNSKGYCCPHTETACQAPRSIGHTCLSQRPGTYWYFDSSTESCLPFAYSGCGGTPNRFGDREACEAMCINKLGECPRGMAPFLTTAGTKQCTLNVGSSCPVGSSCVRSNLGEPICCTSTAQCPSGRSAYVIPGSDSFAACLPDDDNCPQGHQCMQSANVPGFYMCCTANIKRLSAVAAIRRSHGRHMPTMMTSLLTSVSPSRHNSRYEFAAAAPKCPSGLHSNGQRCTVNEIEGCPHGFVCLGGESIRGVCCKASPKCKKRKKPYYVGKKQVLTCGDEEAGCPRASTCTASSIEGVDICCMTKAQPSSHGSSSSGHEKSEKPHTSFSKVPKVVPKCKDGSLPFFALGSRVPQQCTSDREDECPEEYECDMATDENMYCCPAWDRCPNNASPFLVEGSRKPLGCNWMANNCPEGYSCEGSKDRAICCRSRPTSAQCPTGRTPYLYAKRPLVCPPGKKSCPAGYDCVAGAKGGVHICCSSMEHQAPECVNGFAYLDPATNKNQLCDPAMDSCPSGYRCKRSTMANAHVCCTHQLDSRYDGYCPPGQIPYTGGPGSADGTPPTCHMAIRPCPTTAAYQCIYSAEKQNSYCCAPVDTTLSAVRTPFRAHPGRRVGTPADMSNYSAQQLQQYQQQMQLQYQQQRGVGLNANTNGGNGNVMPMAGSQQTTQEAGCSDNEMATMMTGYSNLAQTNPGSMMGYPGGMQTMFPMVNTGQYASASAAQQQFLASVMANGMSNAGQNQAGAMAENGNGTPNIYVASCPPWSKPLLDAQTKLGHPCSTWQRCPTGFTCYSNFPDGRNAHCCTTVPLDNQVVFRANPPQNGANSETQPQFSPEMSSDSVVTNSSSAAQTVPQHAPVKEMSSEETKSAAKNGSKGSSVGNVTVNAVTAMQCPQGMVNIGGSCKRMFFVGQQGCDTDAQCQQRTNGTRCYKNYCACQEGRLIHESKCVLQCPEGFLNIAGRCHDLTTIVFMDSVEERKNGTLGGYCKDTVVREEQCEVESAYCNERSITCQCKPGFELHIGDVGDKEDKGSCKRVEDSKFPHDSSKDAEKRLLDEVIDEGDPENDMAENPAQSPMTFYIIEANDAPTMTNSTATDKGSSSIKIDSAKSERETKKGNGLEKPLRDAKGIDSIFLQADDQ